MESYQDYAYHQPRGKASSRKGDEMLETSKEVVSSTERGDGGDGERDQRHLGRGICKSLCNKSEGEGPSKVPRLCAGAPGGLSRSLTLTHCPVPPHRLTPVSTVHTQIKIREHILSPGRRLVIFRTLAVTQNESSLLLK